MSKLYEQIKSLFYLYNNKIEERGEYNMRTIEKKRNRILLYTKDMMRYSGSGWWYYGRKENKVKDKGILMVIDIGIAK